MALLYRAVNLSKELQRQDLVQRLLSLGVTEYNGKTVDELDYYEAKHALAVELAKRG